jgi:hypothetical protein
MMTRRSFLGQVAAVAGAAGMMSTITRAAGAGENLAIPKQIKAFCIDFNWAHVNQPNRAGDARAVQETTLFAPPGHWAEASPEEHVRWYKELGANVIQTFAVSCNGYAWYKGGFVPPQPGLKYDFLSQIVELAHKKGMLVMGYFCIGANSKWGKDHPDLSYDAPSDIHIPFTDEYLDYLSQSMGDAMKKTGMDGTMIDWVWNPADRLRRKGWLPAEQKLFTQLTGKAFPPSGPPAKKEKLEYERKAINRCWARIKETRDKANPKCVLWLSVSDMADPTIQNSPMLKEVDWAMNESPDPKLYEAGRRMAGRQTRLLQNLVGWATHDAEKFLADPNNRGLDFYGFAEPRDNSLPLPITEYLSKPISAFTGKDRFSANDRNIAALARFYRGLPLEAGAPRVTARA